MNLRYHALNANGGDIRVKSCRQVVLGNLEGVPAEVFRAFKIGGESLNISDKYETFIFFLQFDPVSQAAHIMAQVKFAGWSVSGQYSFFNRHLADLLPVFRSPVKIWVDHHLNYHYGGQNTSTGIKWTLLKPLIESVESRLRVIIDIEYDYAKIQHVCLPDGTLGGLGRVYK